MNHVGVDAEIAFLRDVTAGRWSIEWGDEADVTRALSLCERYGSLRLGLVDGVVMSITERLRARAVATLDERHFGTGSRGIPDRCCLHPRTR